MNKERQIADQNGYEHVVILSSESDDLFKVEKTGKHGVYSYSQKKLVVPIEYDFIYASYPTGCVRVQNGDKLGVYSISETKLIVPIQYDQIVELIGSQHAMKYNGQYRVQLGEKIGRFDPKTQSVSWS